MEDAPYESSMISREVERSFSESSTFSWSSPNGDQFSGILPFSVYPPREDTDLMARCVASWPTNESLSVLEIGCGSGVLACFASSLGHNVTACDINPYAVATARNLAERYHLRMTIHEGGPGPKSDQPVDQWGGHQTYDRIMWNLPYLPHDTSNPQKLGPLEEMSMIAEDNFSLYQMMLDRIQNTSILSKQGIAYFIVSSYFEMNSCLESAWKKGLAARIVDTYDFEDEIIACVSVWHPFLGKGEWNEYETVSSTNAIALSSQSECGSVFVAQHQTQGRGRGKNRWESLDQSTAATWVMMVGEGHPNPMFQLKAGFNVLRLLRFLNPDADFRLKYPNDIYVKHTDSRWKKCCGILVESTSLANLNRVVLGIGLNLYADHPSYGGIFDHPHYEYSVRMLHGCLGSLAYPHEAIHHSIDSEDFLLLERELVYSSTHLFNIIYEGLNVDFIGITNTGDLRLCDQHGEHFCKSLSEVEINLVG